MFDDRVRIRAARSAIIVALVIAAHGGDARSDAAGPGICSQPTWQADGDQLDGRFGTVAPAGDVNGDGFADVLVGAYNYDHPESNEGVVFLFAGGVSGLAASPACLAELDQADARFGDKLSTAGDVNGDGYDDVINGAGLYDHGQADEGMAVLHLGTPLGLSTAPDWTAEGDQADAQFGACVQAAGDVNGDGYDDVIVGSWLYDHGEEDEGAAFVYLGSNSGVADVSAWMGESNTAGAVFGYFCTGAGDLDGDGYDDIVVGARRYGGNGIPKEGRVYVYYGTPAGPSLVPNWILDGGQRDGELGTSPAPAGDVNGDGYDDLLVNAPRYDSPHVDEGKVWLYLGSPAGLGGTPAWTAEGDQDSARFGYHLDGAGDVNGDGFDDVVVAAPGFDANGVNAAGRICLYLGGAAGLSAAPAWIQEGDQLYGELGHAARFVGDVNGDGRDDVMTGAIYRDSPLWNSGRAYLFYGCPDGVVGVAPRPDRDVAIGPVRPNPFARATDIAYALPEASRMRLDVLDPSGRLVAELARGTRGPGRFSVAWNGRTADGRAAPPGVYLVRLETGARVRTVKAVRLP